MKADTEIHFFVTLTLSFTSVLLNSLLSVQITCLLKYLFSDASKALSKLSSLRHQKCQRLN